MRTLPEDAGLRQQYNSEHLTALTPGALAAQNPESAGTQASGANGSVDRQMPAGSAASFGLREIVVQMSTTSPQTLKNHGRADRFYLLLGLIVATNLIVYIVKLVRHPDFHNAWVLVLSLGLIILCLRLRQYPLKVQDRVIRLEERLRLQALAPSAWHAQIYRLSEDQLIGLRFAGDDEVVALAKQALEENLTRKQIKERIRDWRADDWRV